MATIYRKTIKGQHEIETRALKLAPRFRSVLILVDGRRSDDELRHLMPGAGAEALEALNAGGFIEAIGLTSDSAPAASRDGPPPQVSSRPAAAAGAALEQRRRELVRALTDQAGPMSETLALRIERARTEAELLPLIEAAANMVGHVRGRGAGDAFRHRFSLGEQG